MTYTTPPPDLEGLSGPVVTFRTPSPSGVEPSDDEDDAISGVVLYRTTVIED